MARMIKFSNRNDLATCLVHKVMEIDNTANEEFEFFINKDKSIHCFLHTVSQKFGLDVSSFDLISISFIKNTVKKKSKFNEIKLVEHDNRLLFDIGLVFDEVTVNRFLLHEIDPSKDKTMKKNSCTVSQEKCAPHLNIQQNILEKSYEEIKKAKEKPCSSLLQILDNESSITPGYMPKKCATENNKKSVNSSKDSESLSVDCPLISKSALLNSSIEQFLNERNDIFMKKLKTVKKN